MDRVIFRKFKEKVNCSDGGDIIALLPDVEANAGMVMSYMHIGQHGEASRDLNSVTTLATPEEYHDLLEELTSIGYDLRVMKRITRD